MLVPVCLKLIGFVGHKIFIGKTGHKTFIAVSQANSSSSKRC